MRCWKPETSSHSSANFVFGSVMSELLDSSPAGIPLPIYPRTVSSHIAAAESDEASRPQSITGALLVSPRCQFVTCMYPRSPIVLFSHFPFHFPSVFLRWAKHAGRWPPGADLWLAHTALITLPLFNPALSPSTIFSPALFNRTSSSILALRSQSEAAAILMESFALSSCSC